MERERKKRQARSEEEKLGRSKGLRKERRKIGKIQFETGETEI